MKMTGINDHPPCLPVNLSQVPRRQNHLSSTTLHRLGIKSSNSSATCMCIAYRFLHFFGIQFAKIFIFLSVCTISEFASVSVGIRHLELQ